jgi:hexosaminidase
MTTARIVVTGLLAFASANLDGQSAGTGATASIIPQPTSLVWREGTFAITPRTEIVVAAPTRNLGYMLARLVAPATGFHLAIRSGDAAAASAIVLRIDEALSSLGAEGYRLEIDRNRVTIRGASPNGVFYGIQSLLQLLPPEIFRAATVQNASWQVPAVSIEDGPRFRWRGAMLDTSRHFMPKEFVKKFLDLLALHKMNTFHWHLTDDQGWRLEIKRYPRLTEIGAWRKETVVGHPAKDPSQNVFDGERHGGFYSQDDVREIVAYGQDRFINVVPEIEMPGHSHAAIAAYPELGNTGQPLEVSTIWGVDQNILNPEDSTVEFMKNVLSEVMDLFPSRYIHVGGDEADKTQWRASERVQAKIRQLGLKDENELQAWFTRQIDEFLTAHGRRLVGWDEILEGGLAAGATVMSWRGMDGGVAAARAGHDVVMAPTSHTYFDYYQSTDRSSEPLAIGGFLPLDRVYSFDPVPPDLDGDSAKHILGTQGQLWTEYVKGPKQAEFMIFPRLAALAEVAWTAPARKDFADFMSRFTVHARRLQILDVNYRRIDH